MGPTIHKKTFCLSQKYPKHWYICGDKEFFTEFKYGGDTSVKAAASKWWSFFNFFKNFTYNFFVYFQLHSSMSQIYANHATSPSMFFCDVTHNFCCCETNERPLAKHKFIEVEIGFHLEVAQWVVITWVRCAVMVLLPISCKIFQSKGPNVV